MKRRIGWFSALVMVILLFTGCTVIIDDPSYTGNLKGYVGVPKTAVLSNGTYDISNVVMSVETLDINNYLPLSGAIVHVEGASTSVKSDFDGFFYVPNIPIGRRTVRVSHDALREDIVNSIYIERGENPKTPYGYASFIGGVGHYLIIGIDKDSIGADDDAMLVYNILYGDNELAKVHPREVELLLNQDATKDDIRNAIRAISWKASSNDYLVIYFAGKMLADDNLHYLLPYDGIDYGNSPVLISDGELDEWLREFPGSNITVILDGSHSGSFIDGEPTWDSFGTMALAKRGYTVLTSTRPNERAVFDPDIQTRVFTYHLAWGIGEEPYRVDTNGDRKITALELFDYVSDRMDRHNWKGADKHHPVLYEDRGSSNVVYRY